MQRHDTSNKHDNFLADAIKKPRDRHINYWDGFRFGLGFFTANLLACLVLGGLAWVAIAVLHVQ